MARGAGMSRSVPRLASATQNDHLAPGLTQMRRRRSMFGTLARGLVRSYGRQKIFCVGLNKTGTVSLTTALERFGIAVAPERPAELLINDYARRDFTRLVRFCRFFQAFQDVPFSCPFTYQALDQAFPGSKFILTVRQSAELWGRSITRFHSKLFGGGRVPTVEDLAAAEHCYRGFALDFYRAVFGAANEPLYEPETLRRLYESHNTSVLEYFRHRTSDLLVLDVSTAGAMRDLCAFLGRPVVDEPFPWLNKTDDIAVVPAKRAGPERSPEAICSRDP